MTSFQWMTTCMDWRVRMHICMSMYMYAHPYINVHTCMGWLQSVGSIKLQVSFAEYRLFLRALSQKRPIILYECTYMYAYPSEGACKQVILTCMRHIFEWVIACTGWRRPMECLKLRVIFRKRATNYKALLRKMTFRDKASILWLYATL